MRSVFCKTTTASEGIATLTGQSQVGAHRRGDLIIYEITNVPDNIPSSQVVGIFNQTITMPIYGFRFPYDSLGSGKIAKGER